MSKLLLICLRDPKKGQLDIVTPKLLESLSYSIIPDNISPKQPYIIKGDGFLLSIINPVNSCLHYNQSVSLGVLLKPYEKWWQVNGPVPDGSYAIYRVDDDHVELLTDCTASRTIWYIKTEAVFIASSSQRAIIRLIGGYQPNRLAHMWMMSSGCTGPGLSRDERIKQLEPDSRLLLNRATWQVNIKSHPIEFRPTLFDLDEAKELMTKELNSVFDGLDFDLSKWVLPISGGKDSRAILMYLKRRGNPQCVTWGTKDALNQELSDAVVAKKVTKYYDVEHTYYFTDINETTIKADIDRFIFAAEGRVDQFSGYADGLELWRLLYNQGFFGAIRGNEPFAWGVINSEEHSRHLNRLLVYNDYENLKHLIDKFGSSFPVQEIPDWLLKERMKHYECLAIEFFTHLV